MKLARRKRRTQETAELNITAFMNLMVILVPFLLITAVFSRMTVLELNLPALNAKPSNPEEKITLQLQLLVTRDSFEVQDGVLGLLKRIEREGDESTTPWRTLTKVLLELKTRFPEEESIALLFDKTVSYQTIIKVMDHVGSADVVQAANLETVELFPQISIGAIPLETETETEEASSAEQEPLAMSQGESQ